MPYDTRRKIMLERVPKYTLRKLSVGLASVMIGSGILMNSPKVLADTINPNEGTSPAVQSSSQTNQNEGNSEIQSGTGTTASGGTPASSGTTASGDTPASSGTPALSGTTASGDTPASSGIPASSGAPASAKAPAGSTSASASDTAETPDPTAPSDSTSMAIVNDKNKLDKNWIQLDNGKAQIYFTVKGNDQKPYVTSYMDKDVKSTLYTKRFDPNSLELHIEYQNGDKDAGSGVLLSWNEGDLQLDTSRIGTKGLVYTTNSGDEKDVPLSPGRGDYRSYNQWSKVGQDPSKFHLISLWQTVPANSTFTATLPFKYVGDRNVAKSTKVEILYKPYSTTLTFDPSELHPAQIETPAKPTTDKYTVTTGIYNDPQITTSDWINMVHGKAIAYYTAKGKDGKTYVTGYVAANGKSQSIINVKQIDLSTLEYHLIYHNGDKEVGSGLWANFADNKTIAIDTSRLGADGPQLKSQQGWSYKWAINGPKDGGNYYNSWAEYLKAHNNVGDQATNISMTGVAIKPDDMVEFVIPVKYIGQLSASTPSLTFSPHINDYGKGFDQNWADLYFTSGAQIETPAKPTTDKDTVTTGIYNNPQITTSDWINMVHGKAIAYYTAKGKDGKTYVTGYVAANGKSQSIINVNQIDVNSLEYHLIYHNGDKEVGSGLWFNFADGKTLQLDTSRLGADGPQLKSQQGWSYKWSINTGADRGIYYNSWAEYLKAHNNVGDQASQISMTGVALKPDDTIEFNIPVKYIGQLSARTPYLTFSPHINDYGNGFTQNWADLYFTTVKKDLSEVKQVVLLPTEFMGEQPGQSDWKLVKEISKDMPNGWDALKISNFRTYKGSFNMDSLPKGKLPQVVYGSAQYFIDLRQIQQIFANHGYTVKYATNNGKAQEMPFYAYATIPLAKRVDDDRPVYNDPSTWVIQVQAVPAISLNKDQHYVADPNAKPWDTTSMIDEIYAADDAGDRKTRDQLEKLPKTDVDISYEYQAPGAATAAAVDKVDLTKAGVYTVTYSHTYADGRVVKDSRKVYVDGVKQETKDITRTIIVHEPNGTDQTVIQKATLTREVILDATTGEIKSTGEWTTGSWKEFVAPEFKGYTPAPAQIDETTVNKDTHDTTVEISYTANDQQTHVIYVDDDNNGDPIKTEMLNGKTGETVTLQIQMKASMNWLEHQKQNILSLPKTMKMSLCT